MKAIILTAGQGSRLRPLTNDRPKGMLEICGKSIIDRQIDLFKRNGIKDIYLVTGYRSDVVKTKEKVKYYLNEEYNQTNMLYSLFKAIEDFDNNSDVIVSYGDIVYTEEVLKKVMDSKKSISVVVDFNWKDYFKLRFDNPYDDAESLVIDENMNIISIGEPMPDPKNVQAQYIGLIKINKNSINKVIELVREAQFTCNKIGWGREVKTAYLTDLLQELVNNGINVSAVAIYGGWVEIDNLKDYEIAKNFVRNSIDK